MIVIGRKISSTDIEVQGMFTDDSSVESIGATDPPNPPSPQDGKSSKLYLNLSTNELHWEMIDRPLTDSEKLKVVEEQNAQMLLALVAGGLI